MSIPPSLPRMRRTAPSRARRLVLPLLLLAAACDGGGGGETLARPDELRLNVLRGRGMEVPVRPFGTPAGETPVSAEPVVVQVEARIGASVQALPGGTGPALEVRMPAVELRWRAIEPWCRPLHATTPLSKGDTLHNYLRRPAVAGLCRLVVDGVSGGWTFDSDTIPVQFTPDRLATVEAETPLAVYLGGETPLGVAVCCGRDAYGNFVDRLEIRAVLTEGRDHFALTDTTIVPLSEGVGAAVFTTDTVTRRVELWAVPGLYENDWRVTWTCRGLAGPDGAYTDSVRFVMDSAAWRPGATQRRGFTFSLIGTLAAREWRRGLPERTTVTEGFNLYGVQQPGQVEWAPGQVSRRTASGYAGGSLCDPPGEGEDWAGFAPVRMEAR